MNSVSESSARFLGMSAEAVVILLLTVLTAFRFFYSTWLPIVPDETYYFQWSRHLDASYISKGPAVAYTIALGTALWGSHSFGIRFFSVLLAAGTGWQIFLLARRWYDETTAVISVLIAGVLPLFAVGAVIMTIDPLSVFFWIWAANFFSKAIRENRLGDWLWTGFAVGSGFLAKYLNALELLAFLAFLLLSPSRRHLLLGGRFWAMLGVTGFCTLPVWWWNWSRGWPSWHQLADRGHLHGSYHIQLSTFIDFLKMQAIVISPLLFLALLGVAIRSIIILWKRGTTKENEGELLLLVLFLSVFLFYAILSWHLRCEANWPVVSYLSLIIILAARWREVLKGPGRHIWMVSVFLVAWTETVLLHNTSILHLPLRPDPMSRVYGWAEVTPAVNELRQQYHADILIADAYREASIFSYYLPDQPYIYVVKHHPPANQYDFWPDYPTEAPHRALWIRSKDSTTIPEHQFNTITQLEHIVILVRGVPFREYTIYLCENK